MPSGYVVRYVIFAAAILVGLHYIVSLNNEEYGRRTALSNVISSSPLKDYTAPKYFPPKNSAAPRRKARAAFVILARNEEVKGILESVKQMEDRFNKEFRYPYVFLNEVEFSEDFKKWTREVISTEAHYGVIPHDHWFQPDWIDEERAAKGRQDMIDHNIIYGHSVPYRNMCRFNSGFFFRHELLKDYDYYWRLEPSIVLFCDITYDPFLLMQDRGLVYGFTISLPEYRETIPTLWDATKEFMKEHPHLIPNDNGMEFLSDDGGETYNHCHFWSNFEIGDLNFWRGEAYMKFFEHLDSKGGFYYERWGDAPVHSIGAALLAPKDKIHFFEDIGYRHNPFQHCPQGESHARGKCWCSVDDNFDYEGYSCLNKWDRMFPAKSGF